MASRRAVLGAGLTALAAPCPAFAAAPMRGGQAPGWYRFRLGSFECTVVSDGMITIAPAHPTFGGSVATEAQVQDALRAAFLPTDRLPSQINSVVVNTGREVVLLDAGLGASRLFGPGAGSVTLALAAAGVRPDEVDMVAFTHAHGDHCWGIADGAGRDVFQEARFAMTGTDLDFWTSEANLSMPEPMRSLVATTRDVVLPRRARFAAIAANAEIVPGIRAISTPGHTLGHVSYHLESEGQRLLVLGDVANHHVLALMHPDWPFGFDADPAMATATRRRVLDMAATERLQVLGYHFPFPGLGHVEALRDGFVFMPSPWRWG